MTGERLGCNWNQETGRQGLHLAFQEMALRL